MSNKKLSDDMEHFMDSLTMSETSKAPYRSKLKKFYEFQKSNKITNPTYEDVCDFKKWLNLRRYSKNTIKEVVGVAIRYVCWNTGEKSSNYLFRERSPVICECGRLKTKSGGIWKCPFCDSEKKKGRPSKAKPSFIKSNSALAVENEQCKTCQYRTGDEFISRNVNCNYLMITGRAKTKNKDYKLPPHCTYYKRGERIVPKDEREDEE